MPLLLGERESAALASLRQLAEDNPVDMLTLEVSLSTPAGKRAHVAHMTSQSIVLPVNFMVTFSIELGHPGGAARHLNVSIEREGRVPAPEAIWLIAETLGFRGGIKACDKMWPETLRGRTGVAVNVVQLYETADAQDRRIS